MTRKQSNFWDLIQADRVRYFGPNPPRRATPEPPLDLLGADIPPDSVALPPVENDQVSPRSPEMPKLGELFKPPSDERPSNLANGILSPTGHPSLTNAMPYGAGNLPVAFSDLPPIDDDHLDAGLDLSDTAEMFDSAPPISSPAPRIGALAAAMSGGAGQVPSTDHGAANAARDVLPLLPSAVSQQQSGAATEARQASRPGAAPAGQSSPSSPNESSPPAGDSTATGAAGHPPPFTINLGADHRFAKNVLQSMSQKMERLVVDHARHEVERGFHMYQANLRALFPNTRGLT